LTSSSRSWQIEVVRWLALITISSLGCTPLGDISLDDGFGNREVLDFGPAVPGVVRTKSAYLHSQHGEELVLTISVTNPAFEVSFPPEGDRVPANGTHELIVSYRPTPGFVGVEEGSFTVTTNRRELSATMKLSGKPTEVDCTMPAIIDFGEVFRGDTARLELPIKNASNSDTAAFITRPTNPFFSVEGDDGFALSAGETREVTLEFKPTRVDDFSGSMKVQRHRELCEPQTILLTGKGKAASFSWAPTLLDFGDVPMGSTGHATVTFSNLEFVPVTLAAVSTREGGSGSASFTVSTQSLVLPAASRNAAGESVPGVVSLQVEFTPTTSGARAAVLMANTDASYMPSVTISLRGTGTP
jgi:hypothetical protein